VRRLVAGLDRPVRAFEFDRNPLAAAPSEPGHDRDGLLIFSDGRGLLDPRSGKPFDWVASRFAAWPNRVLLTPVPIASWGGIEDALTDCGFCVLPALETSLPAVVQAFSGRAIEVPFVQGAPARFPPLLRGQPLRWLSQSEPAEEDRSALVRQLRGYLGSAAFETLAAAAAHARERDAGITVEDIEFLAGQLEGATEGGPDARMLQEARILAIAYLPWVRQTFFPEWLGRALMRELSPARRELIDQILLQHGSADVEEGNVGSAERPRSL
jgi:hypothetical protein